MIQKAVIADIISNNEFKVSIPSVNDAYSTELKRYSKFNEVASVCIVDGITPVLNVGDNVFVSFEENRFDKPVIVGMCSSSINYDGNISSIEVDGKASLSENTSIGDITGNNFLKLKNISNNVQNQLDSLYDLQNTTTNSLHDIDNNLNALDIDSKNLLKKLRNMSAKLDSIYSKVGIGSASSNSLMAKIDSIDIAIEKLEKTIGEGFESQSIVEKISNISKDIDMIISSINMNYSSNSISTSLSVTDDKFDTLIKCYMYDSTCYKGTTKGRPVGILWHSTAVNATYVKRFVQPSKKDTNYNALINKIGKNYSGSDWNSTYVEAGLNAWIGKIEDGSIATIQTMPWDYRPWGCGKGNYGSCNGSTDGPFWIQFEICEDDHSSLDYFKSVYNEACKLTAYLCYKFNIDPNGTVDFNGIKVPTILCHYDSHKLGLGSGHYDIYHWFPKFNKDMDDVRKDVSNLLSSINSIIMTNSDSSAYALSSQIPSINELFKLAREKYNISENNIIKSLKLVTHEGYSFDSTMDYLMACTCINRCVDYPNGELYSLWGGGDAHYTEKFFADKPIRDHAYTAVYNALLNLNRHAWGCHGVVAENGYTRSYQKLNEAIYVTEYNGRYFAVWDLNAKWYRGN